MTNKNRHSKVSKPIPIGMHHTVCGHEAKDLAKRLTDELASQQAYQGGSLGSQRNSPERETRARSFENRDAKAKSKDFVKRCRFNFLIFFFLSSQATTNTIKVCKQ